MTTITACPSCQYPNPTSGSFCDRCGQFLGWPSDDPAPTPTHRQRQRHKAGRTPPPEAVPPPASTDIHAALRAAGHQATSQQRSDLALHLQQVDDHLRHQTHPVVVCGEFKVGKSTLINALLRRNICPVDPDITTAVPTIVTWAETPRVRIHEQDKTGRSSVGRTVGLDDLQTVITTPASGQHAAQQIVEVAFPHRMLRSGLSLIDSPGAGGLESAEAVMTLSALSDARGALFVTDAAQELTQPELEFLADAARRCPATVLVLSKTDLHQNWQRIRDLDRQHLHRAGLEIPVIAVSSILRIAADAAHQDLNSESGFDDLIRFIADVVNTGRTEAADEAATELAYVTQQLRQVSDAEQLIRTRPESSTDVVTNLTEATRRTDRLTRSSASWQQLLTDGIQDLNSDVEFDLSDRLRSVSKNAEELIEHSDPKHTWKETESWLRRQLAIATIANRDLITERTHQLASTVAAQFNLDAQQAFTLHLPNQAGTYADIPWTPLTALPTSGGSRLVSYAMAARTGYAVAMLIGAAAVLIPFAPQLVVGGVAALLGTGIGGKLISSEVKRQRGHRQQQAKIAARRWIDDIALHLTKQTREQLRTAQRQLRDEFQARADHLHNTSLSALDAARTASQSDTHQAWQSAGPPEPSDESPLTELDQERR